MVALIEDMIEDMLLRLRILGKFLGYLYFSPYNYPIPNYMIKNLIEIRNNVTFVQQYFRVEYI